MHFEDPQSIDTGTRRFINQMKIRDHEDYSITKISQNTEKSLGDLKRLAIPQTPVKKTSANVCAKNSQMKKIIVIL